MKKLYLFISLVLSLCIYLPASATPSSAPLIVSETPSPAPLPADLLYFTAHMRYWAVSLRWGVTADPELAMFEVERSSDNLTFQPIGTVQAVHGNDPKERYYFVDDAPLDGIAYYRLTFVLTSGERIMQDAMVRVNLNNLLSILTYPNPGSQKMNISADGATKVVITSLTGMPVVTLEPGQTEVDISQLPPGIYLVKAQFGDYWQTKTITVQ